MRALSLTTIRDDVASSRLAGVDVLRGLSVLLVVLHHVNLRFVLSHLPVQNRLPAPLEQVLFWSGYYAVIVFFVISGFLITGLSLRRWGSLGSVHIGSFYNVPAVVCGHARRQHSPRLRHCADLLGAAEPGNQDCIRSRLRRAAGARFTVDRGLVRAS